MPRDVLARGQRGQPARLQPHLARVARQREAREPGAVMRAGDRHDVVHARGVGLLGVPAPHRQAAHAVRHDDGRQPRGALQPLHRLLDELGVLVDRAEHRLEVHGDEGHVGREQAPEPGVPQPAVADEAVHQQHAPAAARAGRHVVGEAPAAEGLPPGEHPRGGLGLAPPRAQQLRGAGARCRVVAARQREHRELQRQHGGMPAQRQQHARHRPGLVAGAPPQHAPGRRERQQPEGDGLLQPREHQASATGRPPSSRASRLASRLTRP